MQQPTAQKSQKKKLLTAAGIFALPVIAILVAVMALMGRHAKPAPKAKDGSAFNTSLPSPNLPKGEKNKLEIYMQAQEDSLKKRQERAKDPFIEMPADASGSPFSGKAPSGSGGFSRTTPVNAPSPTWQDDNDKKVSEKLQKIYAALGAPAAAMGSDHGSSSFEPTPTTGPSPQVARLEQMMSTLREKDTSTDPKLRQIKDVLDQIMALKYPDRVASTLTGNAKGSGVLAVEAAPPVPEETAGPAYEETGTNGFFGLSDDPDSLSHTSSATLQAVVHSSQVVQTGSIVKLRLLQPIYIGGEEVPANAFIYGPAAITGERVTIQLTNAIYNGRIYPISLKVYDGTDGLEGLYVPGMITRDVVKQNMSQGVSGLNIATLDPSLGAQAAAAGIETARNLLSRKISLVKATLKAGHVAILKGANNAH